MNASTDVYPKTIQVHNTYISLLNKHGTHLEGNRSIYQINKLETLDKHHQTPDVFSELMSYRNHYVCTMQKLS